MKRNYQCTKYCEYFQDYDALVDGDIGILNYHVALMKKSLRQDHPPREILICDEAHNIEKIFMDYISLNLKSKMLEKMGIDVKPPTTKKMGEVIEWIVNDLFPSIRRVTQGVEEELEDIFDPDRERELLKQKDAIKMYGMKLQFFFDNKSEIEWTYCEKENIFKPLYVKDFTKHLWIMGRKVLLMSATILDSKTYSHAIGIDDKKVASLKMPSTFPVENRIIDTSHAVFKMGYKDIDDTLPNLKNRIEEIIRFDHPKEKGIIHTNTYKIAEYLKTSINSDRFLLPMGKNREKVLNEHFNSEHPTILLSPSMTEGVDLKDDHSRFQIICKIPYPFLGDKQINLRMKQDPDWYQWLTCLTIVQAYGRSIRNEKDWASTYILDNKFKWFIKQNERRLPKWFKEAIR